MSDHLQPHTLANVANREPYTQIITLSSGTIASLINSASYDDIEAFQRDFAAWLLPQTRHFNNWIDALTEYRPITPQDDPAVPETVTNHPPAG